MKKKSLAWVVVGGMLIAAGGLGAVACSSDDTSKTTSTTKDATAGGDSTANDDGSTGTDGNSGGDSATVDCGKAPTLHPSDDAGVYCPFQDAGADADWHCAPGDFCCMYPQKANTASTCIAPGTCPGDVPDSGVATFECDEKADCTGGKTCCLKGTPTKDPACYYFGSRVLGSECVSGACPSGEYEICSHDTGDCPSGKTCTPFATKSKQLGACL